MGTLPVINDLVANTNYALDFVFLWGGLFLILLNPFRFFAKGMDKYDKEQQKNPNDPKNGEALRELFSQFMILLAASVLVGFLWALPELLPAIIKYYWSDFNRSVPLYIATLFRWAIVFGVATFYIYVYGHEFGEGRWLVSSVGHIALIYFGLVLDGWFGLVFISAPVLLVYYAVLYRLAMAVMPTANPEDPKERWKRYVVFVSYVWGIQFPMVVIDEHAWKKPDTRIPGDFTFDYPVPGMIWTKAHQVVGITGGTSFKRVDGPGLIFTGQMERAEQVFDLRLQLRTNEIDVVTKDGISLKVRVFTAFRIDPEKWTDEQYKELRTKNTVLRGAQNPSYIAGSFAYSPQRVQAALGTTSTKTGGPAGATGPNTIYWDQWALNVVEDQARKVIAQKKLDELWRPAQDTKFANALDIIANELKNGAAPIFRSNGILLLVSRVVNFSFPTDKDQSEITKQQIDTWGSEWEGKRSTIMAEAEAEAKSAQQSARTYAASLMLRAIEDGLQATQNVGLNLPPHITAMLFSALQDYIDKMPDEITSSDEQHYIKETQETAFFPHKEKK